MKLKEYLKINGIRTEDFAKEIDFHRDHLYKIMNGNRRPAKKTMRAIVKITKGKVTIEDLLEPYESLNKN